MYSLKITFACMTNVMKNGVKVIFQADSALGRPVNSRISFAIHLSNP